LEHLLEDEERKMSEMAKKNRTDDAGECNPIYVVFEISNVMNLSVDAKLVILNTQV